MTRLSQHLVRVRSAPAGPSIGAFFGYDGALTHERATPALRADAFADKALEEVTESCERHFRHKTAALLRPQMWQLIQAHRDMGHRTVIVSSRLRVEIEPVAKELEADHILGTELEVVSRATTGAIRGQPLSGAAMGVAIRALADGQEIDLRESFAYGHHDADVPFLETFGHPTAVCPQDGLRTESRRRSWATLDFPHHREPIGLSAVSTAAYYGSFVGGAALGAVIGVLRRDPSAVARIGAQLGNNIGLSLAGIRINVVAGEEYLNVARPCVFVFNHQSKLDAAIVLKLLRNDFTAIAKKEARAIPVIGGILASSGVVFIDRANTDKAIDQLAPAVAKLREEGVSLALAPEGTRSATPRLGAFRKGAFHIAMQAGVPIVPIVISNAGELMWRGAQLMHRGTIEVCVLPPVDTSEWKPETIAAHTDDVRNLFIRALADMPAASNGTTK